MGMVRTFQLTQALTKMTVIENMRLGATGQSGERLLPALFTMWRGQEDENTARAMSSLPVSSSTTCAPSTPDRCRVVSASCWRWPAG